MDVQYVPILSFGRLYSHRYQGSPWFGGKQPELDCDAALTSRLTGWAFNYERGDEAQSQ